MMARPAHVRALKPVQTMRLAARSLGRSPGIVLTAVLTLGVGLSAAVMLLGVIDSGARSLPVPEGHEIVQIRVHDGQARRMEAPGPINRWTIGAGIDAAGALELIERTFNYPDFPAVRASGAAMHTSVLRLLGVPPALGRLPGGDPADASAVVLGWALWQDLGGDRALLGRRIDLDGKPHTVSGVMPEGFGFPERQQFWTVLPASESGDIVARIRDGLEPEAVARALEARLANAPVTPAAGGPYRVTLHEWTHSRDTGGEGVALVALSGLVALLLIVCAANVATLLMVRGTERSNQLAVYAALGASRLAVGFQLFAEALIITLLGGAAGLAGGFGLLRWMEASLAQHWGYYWMKMEVRLPVLLATAGVVLLTALLAGTAPALQAMRINLSQLLAGQGRGKSGRRHKRLGRIFVGAQVTLSTIGLIAAAYLGWGFLEIGEFTQGMPLDRMAIASVTLPSDRYQQAEAQIALASALRNELQRISGVQLVSVANAAPATGGGSAMVKLPDDPADAPGRRAGWLAADENLAAAYDLALLAGRNFNASDDANAPRVALVTPAFARARLHGTPIGARIRLDGIHAADEWVEVVGVVQDWVPERSGSSTGRVILPLAQLRVQRFHFAMRTTSDPSLALPGIRAAVARVDARLAVEDARTLRDLMAWYLRIPRVLASFGMAGGMAGIIVAAIGLYGVISFQVRSRMAEIGVRMALGAGTRRILSEVIFDGLARIAPGIALGFALGLVAARLLGDLAAAARTAPSLPLFTGVVLTMLLVGVFASLEPALRAARLDPQEVLRAD